MVTLGESTIYLFLQNIISNLNVSFVLILTDDWAPLSKIMRLFKGKITYNQRVSVADSEKNSTVLTAHECDREGANQINANSNVGTNSCIETDIQANRANETKNDQNTKEKKEVGCGVQQIDKNGECKFAM